MLDVWAIDLLLVFGALAWSVAASLVGLPHVRPGSEFELFDAEELQARYERRLRWRQAVRFGMPLIALYLIVRSALSAGSDAPSKTPSSALLGWSLAGALCVGLAIGATVRYLREKRFVADHRAFADSYPVLLPRLVLYLTWTAPVLLLADTLTGRSSDFAPVEGVAAMVAFLLGLRLTQHLTKRRRTVLPPDSSLGLQVSELITKFGYRPKAILLSPSLMANGFALRDGTVLLTTALRTILSEAEVCGVIAHELSHVRDNDARRYIRIRLAAFLPTLLTPIGLGAMLGLWEVDPGLVFPTLLTTLFALGTASSWVAARLMHPVEFKCDADAAKVGLGREQAAALDKLYRFMGLPLRWVETDRYLLTHPSTDERIRRLLALSEGGC